MSQNSTLNINPSNSTNNQTPQVDNERDLRRQAREERRAIRRENGPWVGGLILIVLGLVFLLQNMGVFYLENWWALFILIPAIGSFSTAYFIYRSNGNRFSYAVRGSLLGGVAFAFVSLVFLFNVNFGVFWPVLLIIAGAALLLNFLLPA